MASLFLPLIICISLLGCAHKNTKNFAENEIPQSAFQSTDPNQVTIAFVGLNDFHGSLLPRERKLASKNGEVIIQSGGASALASMMSILRDEMKGNLLIIDAGDQ